MAVIRKSRYNWLLAFIVLALAVRMVIPTGWMPSFAEGRATITLCTSAGMVEAWLDEDGKIHKQNPTNKKAGDQPCAFAGLNTAAGTPDVDSAAITPAPAHQQLLGRKPGSVAIGLGLAAPPPPATAPPALI
jgi:hypothetical protein